MGVPFAKIEELIEVCKQVDIKVYEDDWDKRIHVRDIQHTLQKLIDDEMEELNNMAKRFIEEGSHWDHEFVKNDLNEVSEEYDRVKKERKKEDWPHGI